MPRMIYDYTKTELENVSFDTNLFYKRLKKATKSLLPHEMDQLYNWLNYFTENKPDLKKCLIEINSKKEEGVC